MTTTGPLPCAGNCGKDLSNHTQIYTVNHHGLLCYGCYREELQRISIAAMTSQTG